MDKIKKIFLIRIPLSICNFRCHYCYLSAHEHKYEGYQPKPVISPENFGKAFAMERVGGPAFANFCADGETLLTTNIDLYIKAFVEQGHYAEVVTNLTITKVLDKILAFDESLLKRIEFKCSFHYLELKKRNLLDLFVNNVKKIWAAGCSANIEITPSDELIPFIDEIKELSMREFGALPHITVARNEATSKMKNLTKLSPKKYVSTWSQFDSDFWKFKYSIFGKGQKSFCYAGSWGYTLNFETGDLNQCYIGKPIGNMYEDLTSPLPNIPIGRCPESHCHNGHALMSLGFIPRVYSEKYGDMRDRTKIDGSHWLQTELKAFFNTKLECSNEELSDAEKKIFLKENVNEKVKRYIKKDILPIIPQNTRKKLKKIYHTINGDKK